MTKVSCYLSYQLNEAVGAFKLILHSYLIVYSVHTTYCCFNNIFEYGICKFYQINLLFYYCLWQSKN